MYAIDSGASRGIQVSRKTAVLAMCLGLGIAVSAVCETSLKISSITVASTDVVLGITNLASLGSFTIEQSSELASSNAWQQVTASSSAASYVECAVPTSNTDSRMFYRIHSRLSRADAAFQLITPYVNESDVEFWHGYNSRHDATDIATKADNTAFRAVCDGEVTVRVLMKDVTPNSGGSPYQLVIFVKYNNTFYVEYNFETKCENAATGAAQLAAIAVSLGQTVAQGDIIGRLQVAPTNTLVGIPHVHWAVVITSTNDPTVVVRDETTGQDVSVVVGNGVWPEPYFTEEARTSFLSMMDAAGLPRYP